MWVEQRVRSRPPAFSHAARLHGCVAGWAEGSSRPGRGCSGLSCGAAGLGWARISL